jgi:hypothetical protein
LSVTQVRHPRGRLDRPPGTVRGWLRAFARRTGTLQGDAVTWTVQLGEGPSLPRPCGRPFTDALAALACAANAYVLRSAGSHQS